MNVCNVFFRCDTVTNAVMMQYSRDFKGHLASLFLNENINLGKKYVFDIRRTSKEVYDHARRALYNSGVVDLVSGSCSGERSSPSRSPSRDSQQDEGLDCGSCQQSRALQQRLQKLREALLCMLCCEEEIDVAFCPCGHMVCCQTCANQLQVRMNRRFLRGDSSADVSAGGEVHFISQFDNEAKLPSFFFFFSWTMTRGGAR